MVTEVGKSSRSPNSSVRLVDIARQANVSRVAVAQVLLGTGGSNVRISDQTRRRIHKIAKEFNYTPNKAAQQLAGKRSQIVGAIIDSCAPKNHFNRLSLMEHEASRQGYRFMIGQAHDKPEQIKDYVEDFDARGIEGVVCLAHDYPGRQAEIVEAFDRLKSVVFIGKPAVEREDLHYVAVDVAAGIRQAYDYLWSKNRRKIGLVTMGASSSSMQERYKGFLQSLEAHQVPFDERMVCQTIPGYYSMDERHTFWGKSDYYPVDTVYENISQMVKAAKIDAILAANDNLAILAIKSLRRLGYKVPQDIAVVGFDNIDMAELFEPALTTIDQENAKLSQAAIGMLFQLINGDEVPPSERKIVIKPRLVIRESA